MTKMVRTFALVLMLLAAPALADDVRSSPEFLAWQQRAEASVFCEIGGWPTGAGSDYAPLNWTEEDIRCGSENRAREARWVRDELTPEDIEILTAQNQARDRFYAESLEDSR